MITFSWWLLLIVAGTSIFVKQLLEQNNVIRPSASIKNALWILLAIGLVYDATGIASRLEGRIDSYTNIDVYNETGLTIFFLVIYYLVSLLFMFLWLRIEKLLKVSPYILICLYVLATKASFAIFRTLIIIALIALAITALVIWIREKNKATLTSGLGTNGAAEIPWSGASSVQQSHGGSFQMSDSIRYILGGILSVGGILLVVYGIVEMNSDEQKMRDFVYQVTNENMGNQGLTYIVFGAISTIAGIVMLGIRRKPVGRDRPMAHPVPLQQTPHTAQAEQAAAHESGTNVQPVDSTNRAHKFCGDCGTKNGSINAFCVNCGVRFK